jgi:glucan 1,3-beta-glucosidase
MEWRWMNETSWEHWPTREALWIGEWDRDTQSYTSINQDNIDHALAVVQNLTDRYASHS